MSHFDTYGRMAKADVDDIIQNGRYYAQADAEKFVPEDVFKKLRLNENDVFLDVGCGLGLNLYPALTVVKEAHACDHTNVIDQLVARGGQKDIVFHRGNFLDIDFAGKYSKILSYSVLPALPNKEVVLKFIEKITMLLDPSGIALLGDLANVDKKARFMNSKRGQAFQKEWQALVEQYPDQIDIAQFQEEGDANAVRINDDFIIEMLKFVRHLGFHAYVVDQPQHLPFGNTREDIVIVGPEYEDL